jgi:hypothetical protein
LSRADSRSGVITGSSKAAGASVIRESAANDRAKSS